MNTPTSRMDPEVPKTIKQKIEHWGVPIVLCTLFGFGVAMLGGFARPDLHGGPLIAFRVVFTLAGSIAGVAVAAFDYRLRTK